MVSVLEEQRVELGSGFPKRQYIPKVILNCSELSFKSATTLPYSASWCHWCAGIACISQKTNSGLANYGYDAETYVVVWLTLRLLRWPVLITYLDDCIQRARIPQRRHPQDFSVSSTFVAPCFEPLAPIDRSRPSGTRSAGGVKDTYNWQGEARK